MRPSDPNVPEGTGAVIAFVDPVIVQLDAQTYKAYLKEVCAHVYYISWLSYAMAFVSLIEWYIGEPKPVCLLLSYNTFSIS